MGFNKMLNTLVFFTEEELLLVMMIKRRRRKKRWNILNGGQLFIYD
jgi:hypothetical protein